ncbi:MAG TPA: sigma factor-like helix-turn-helix DNA-binding protein [Clostridiales bacterium]|nr:sigma factor-like helix-turn-helix DNA-binding protein [Clostridiales bacterium]
MKELFKVSLLLDFYGQMLTKRQYDVLDLYYNSDYTLAEIAEELDISRQGVHDNIKRGKAALFELERKLGLVARFSDQKEKASKVLKILEQIESSVTDSRDREKLSRAKLLIRSMMED